MRALSSDLVRLRALLHAQAAPAGPLLAASAASGASGAHLAAARGGWRGRGAPRAGLAGGLDGGRGRRGGGRRVRAGRLQVGCS